MRRYGWIVGFVLLVMGGAVVPIHGQTARRCADGKKLTLPVVEGYVTRKQDAIAIARIEGCHVGFSLDAMTLQRLAHAGISEPVFQALNLDTVAHMTAEQAHAEVAALEGKPADVESQKAFQTRIQFLKQAEYMITEPFTHVRYEEILHAEVANVGADEYQFTPVTEADEKVLASSPKGLVIVRHYDEDEMETRVLRVPSAHIQVKGESHRAQMKKLIAFTLGEMREALKQGDTSHARGDPMAVAYYNQAYEKATDVLNTMDKENQEAKDGKKLATDKMKALAAEAQLAEKCKKNGVFCEDPSNPQGLMWMLKDNGGDIDGHGAEAFCKAQRGGGYADWRMPTILELRGLFDEGVTRDTPPTTQAFYIRKNGAVERLPKGTVWQYHIKGGIELTGTQVWSATDDDASDGSKWAYGDFQNGEGYRRNAKDKAMLRALCVRGAPAAAVKGADPTVAGVDIQHVTMKRTGPGETLTDADKLERQGEQFFLQKKYKDAFPLAEQSCSQGSQDGCALEAILYARGLSVDRDTNRAVTLSVHSCETGSARGCEVLGTGYYIGMGVGKDQFRAADLFRGSCEAGFKIACFDLGMQTLDGSGVPKDVPKALVLIREACSSGFDQACDQLKALRNRGIQ